MKTDINLIRNALLYVEDKSNKKHEEKLFGADTHVSAAYYNRYTLRLPFEYLLANGYITEAGEQGIHAPSSFHITVKGNCLADLIRNDEIWKRVKQRIELIGGTASLSIIQELAEDEIRKKLHLK